MVFEFLKGFVLFVAPLKFVCVAKDLQWQHVHPIVTGFGVEEGRCPIQCWIASQFERGRSPIASRFNRDKKVIDSGLG